MLKSRFARRKALNIRRNEEEDEESQSAEHSSDQADDQDDGPVVKRPLLTPRGSGRVKKSSSLRLSFGPGEAPGGENGVEEFTPKKSRLSREALERSASHSSLARSAALPSRGTPGEDRPSYSKEYLDELRSATPSAPRSPKSKSTLVERDGRTPQAIDVVAKFGVQAATATTNSAIPSEAEIREKKERRARLAREQEYVGLGHDDNDDDDDEQHERRYNEDEDDDDDNPHHELTFRPRSTKWAPQETRLVRDDEDFAEGFDDFVEDSSGGKKILIGKQAELKQRQQARETMRQMIEEAEGGGHRRDNEEEDDDESTDESEAERRAAYEEAQTRAGTNRATLKTTSTTPQRPTTPPRITPIPSLDACISRLESTLREKQLSHQQKIDKLQEIARRKVEVVQRQAEIQKLLEEASSRYEKLRAEAGLAAEREGNGSVGKEPPVERGLESLGNMQMDYSLSVMNQD